MELTAGQLRRLRLARQLIILLFVLLAVRLFYLQFVHGAYYKQKSENNYFRKESIIPLRGEIYDRNGQLIAGNKANFVLEVAPENISQEKTLLRFIARHLKLNYRTLLSAADRANRYRRADQNFSLIKELNRKQLNQIVDYLYEQPAIILKVKSQRDYFAGPELFPVLGYIREVNNQELEQFSDYEPGDLIGKTGVEKFQELQLAGTKGTSGRIVKASGQLVQSVELAKPQAGENLQLSIDQQLQKVAYEALGDLTGAAVAIDPNTGEVLLMVSKPSVNAEIFTRPLDTATWQILNNDPLKPLSNRVVSAAYPPGSIFKIFMALAGLQEKIVTPAERTYCSGVFRVARARFHCHRRSGHGAMNMTDAIAGSCNVYFYTLGQKLGIDNIAKYAKLFGFGNKTGIELNYERAGLVPSREWKQEYFRNGADKIWYPGETPSVVIGQGALQVTPLQIAMALSAVVNGGKLYKPGLVRGGENQYRTLDLLPENIAAVKAGMYAVVNSPRGTGKRVNLGPEYNLKIAGKTATSQIKSSKFLKGKESENHALFASYAPADQPEIVLVILAEHGGHGGATAAPVAKQIYQEFFKSRVKDA